MEIAIVTAIAALAGVWLGERRAEHRQNRLLREESLRAQRDIVVEVLLSCRAWLDTVEVLVVALGRFTDQDMVDFLDTDTGRGLMRSVDRRTAALVRARLFLADATLSERITTITEFVDSYAKTVSDPILKSRGDVEAVAGGIKKLRELRAEINRFETEAAARLVSTIDTTSSRWWKIR